ncbi:MAG TPA: response regulator [Capsulimonadaceae bacterium]|jgi:CheY-like chemotaxis protein
MLSKTKLQLEAQPARILCVDDEASIRELLRVNLSKVGYEVFLAVNGQEALEVAVAQHPDLILLDLSMPVMDGFEAIAALSNDAETSDIPIVVISGAGNPHERVKALEAGVDDFICKPFDRSELLARVRSLLRVRRLHRTMIETNEELQDAFNMARDAEARYRSLVNDSLDAVFVVDAETGTVRECNEAAAVLTGYASTDLPGLSFSNLCPDAPTGTQGSTEAVLFDRGETAIPVFVKVSVVRSVSANLLQYTVRNLQPMKELERRRIDSERLSAVVETAVTINEEVNTPLSVIINNTETLRAGLPGVDSKVYTRLDHTLLAAKQIQTVVAKLAHVQRATSKEYLPGTQMLDLETAIADEKKG